MVEGEPGLTGSRSYQPQHGPPVAAYFRRSPAADLHTDASRLLPAVSQLRCLQATHTVTMGMPSVDDEGQTDRVATPTRAGLRRATPHASPRWLAADDVTVETYYYGRRSAFIERCSRYQGCRIGFLKNLGFYRFLPRDAMHPRY